MLLAGTISLLLATTASASKLVSALPATLKDYEPFGGADAKILQSPADWNRNTYPIPVHSHNDYERTVPVLEALSYGARSVESDVWLNPDDNVLYVGHDPFSLSRERTFDALTIQPLMWAIGQANRANANYSDSDKFFATLQRSVQSYFFSWNGYYSLGVGMTSAIQLMVDVKTNGTVTWPYVVKALEPLRKKGWLTRMRTARLFLVPSRLSAPGAHPSTKWLPSPRATHHSGPCTPGTTSTLPFLPRAPTGSMRTTLKQSRPSNEKKRASRSNIYRNLS
ncbi:hypothetical protein M427DRAFT_147221 [Gonapodya prolifera JEL478]|uniref:Altered inheritance of mitochondria protein 6 n=1 Tax=Gonapodya prolifera (strain JEL478) TaxID=1344416 RepID=A0A139A612_GONPJ|nr:hypothetical protein M427DRAFT_147221 [Gonapodya prolifera JEL478]|eukprot:KXS12191.1 hypothetical protein M427DRAFT_147221 [Gonapodya prolifera JEL478]